MVEILHPIFLNPLIKYSIVFNWLISYKTDVNLLIFLLKSYNNEKNHKKSYQTKWNYPR